jgi:hypothetical protein
MTTVSRLRVSVVWMACLAVLPIIPVPLVRGQEGERHVILVNVLDREGNQVLGLSAANFRGEYQGQPVTVVSGALDSAPRRIAVAVDVSASLMSARDGEAGFRAAQDLVTTLAPQHRVAIFTVADGLTMHSNLTNDRTTLQKALRAARDRPSGPTALYDGVSRLSVGFTGRKLGDAICLFTDGDDTIDRRDPKAVVLAVARTGVRVFVVRASQDRAAGPRSERATAWMLSIADATGGSVSWLGESRERSQRFYSLIAEAYRLEVAFPRTVDEPREWKLEVVGPDGKALPEARLAYPHLVVPLVVPK